MVRLLLVLAPAVSILSGMGVSYVIRFLAKNIKNYFKKGKSKSKKYNVPPEVSLGGIILVIFLVCTYCQHANIAGAEYYSHPSVILGIVLWRF